MENNFDEPNESVNGGIGRVNDTSAIKKPYGTVTTLYYSCDSNIFKSSESSVQVVSASNYATIGHTRPNFCELDIIAKKEKLKLNVDFVPLQTITEELKSLPMSSNMKCPVMNSTKDKVSHKTTREEPEVLCLINVIKDDRSFFKPTLKKSKETNATLEKKSQNPEENVVNTAIERTKVDETCQTKKTKRNKSRKRKETKDIPQQNYPEEIKLSPFATSKFVDLEKAKTMYFAELPNTSTFIDRKQETTETARPEVAEKLKKKKQKRSKPRNEHAETQSDQKSDKVIHPSNIIINKVENEYPPLSSPGSLTTVPSQAFKKRSDLSFGSLEVPKSTKTDCRKRNNSPNSEYNFLDEFLRKYKTDTTVYKGKYRKKHRTSPKVSSDEGMKKNRRNELNVQQETEVRVIYKIDEIKTHGKHVNKDPKKKEKGKHSERKTIKTEKTIELQSNLPVDGAQIKSRDRHKSGSRKKDDKSQDEMEKNKKLKISGRSNERDDSILNLYLTSKSLRSESCTMVIDEDFPKASGKKKRKSRKPQSRSSSLEKITLKSKKDDFRSEEQVTVEELLQNTKERKLKQRSKSRVIDEKVRKTKHKHKSQVKETCNDLVKKIARKSASDLPQGDAKDFDGHKSIEGMQKDEKTAEKEHGSSKTKKNKANLDVTTKSSKTRNTVAISAKLPYEMEETTLSREKEKRRRSKSYAPKKLNDTYDDSENEKPPTSSKSHTFEGNSRSSETKAVKRRPRSKKSKSLVRQNRRDVLDEKQVPSEDKFYDDLRKISTIQHVDATTKRFKVVSRTIKSKVNDGSTTQSTEQSYLNKKFTGSHRFKTYMCSEKEKEAILKLPIFNKEFNECLTQGNKENLEEFKEEIYRKKSTKSTKSTKQECETSEVEETLLEEEKLKKRKKVKKSVFRKEASTSRLNVPPLIDLYRKPSKNTIAKRQLFCRKYFEIPRMTREVVPHSEIISEDTDLSVDRKESVRKLNSFTMILGEKILEICTKAIGGDGHIIEGFTVSGSEPPKKLRSHDTRKDRIKLMAKVGKLHAVSHPSVEILDGVMKMEVEKKEEQEINCLLEEKQLEGTASNVVTNVTEENEADHVGKEMKNELTQADSREIVLPTKTPVLLKTKRKFVFGGKTKSKLNLKRGILGKLASTQKNAQTSTTESRSNSDFVIDIKEKQNVSSVESVEIRETLEPPVEKITWKQKNMQKQEVKNISRMNSAVKLMESSLQIIKEESQSTDSSSKHHVKENLSEVKQCESDIKETQTDINVDDIEKMKEVIYYLYNTIDLNKMKTQETTEVAVKNIDERCGSNQNLVKQDSSSTDTSSYHEQFKNFVRNVTPKFCGLKKSKQEIGNKTAPVKKSLISDDSIPSRIPMLCRRPSTCKVTSKSTVSELITNDSLSNSDRSSSLSDPKDSKKPEKSSKNFTRRRSSSVDILTSGYLEKYKNTRELIQQQRLKRAESEDSSIRKKASLLEPQFKSSTSVSDFSSIIISYKEDVPLVRDENDVAVKKSEEKYVQCILVADITKEFIDKNIGTVTEDEKENTPKGSKLLTANQKSTESLQKNKEIKERDLKERANLRNCEDKSLQTSIKIENPLDIKKNSLSECRLNVACTDIACKSNKKKMIDDLFQRISSCSFVSPRGSRAKIRERTPEKIDSKKKDSVNMEKTKFEKLKRAFVRKEDHLLKNNVFSYNISEKRRKSNSKKASERDYINLIKLERHLEQVLGLYPSVCKAIRAQMDDSTVRKLDKRLKLESPELFASCDTLATTIDTVTEYKNTDSFIKYPSFSESNLNKFNKYCENLKIPTREYQLQEFIKAQNLMHNSKAFDQRTRKITEDVEDKIWKRKCMERKKDISTTPYPYTESTSSSKSNKDKPQYKRSRKYFKANKRKRKNKIKDIDTASSIFSKDGIFNLSSNSSCCRDKWSIASPLYSITTPSLNVSCFGRSQSSMSLMINRAALMKITKSKSVIEMSSISKVNRRLTIQHLLETNQLITKEVNKQNVLVVSVNPSGTVFATPSKFLARVEKHLKKCDESKFFDNAERIGIDSQQTMKKQVDEQSFHSIFFSESKNTLKSPVVSEKSCHKPFYIHKRTTELTDDEFPDSLEVKAPTSKNDTILIPDEEDLGNFSADSLETGDFKLQRKVFKCDIPYLENRLENLPPQTYFVYSNTIDYDKDFKQTNNESNECERNRNRQVVKTKQSLMPTKSAHSREDTSNTFLSESGYESTKTKRTASIRNFFKKGGSLLDIFRNNSKNKILKTDSCEINKISFTNFSNLWQKKNEHTANSITEIVDVPEDKCNREGTSPYRTENTVYWSSIKQVPSPKKETITTFREIAGPSETKRDNSTSPHRNKGTQMSYSNKKCPCSDPVKSYQKQMDECHAYAEKVLLESHMRREGYYKQYEDFKEIPLELLIGKRVPNKSRQADEVSIQTRPRCKPVSTQSRKRTKAIGINTCAPIVVQYDTYARIDESCTTPSENLQQSRTEITVLKTESTVRMVDKKVGSDRVKNPISNVNEIQILRHESPARKANKKVGVSFHKVRDSDVEAVPSKRSLKYRNLGATTIRSSQSLNTFITTSPNATEKRDRSTSVHVSRKSNLSKAVEKIPIITRFRSKSKRREQKDGCYCDGRLFPGPSFSTTPSLSQLEIVPQDEEEELRSYSSLMDDPVFFIKELLSDMIEEAIFQGDCELSLAQAKKEVSLPPEKKEPSIEDVIKEESKTEEPPKEPEPTRSMSEDFRNNLTDKEVFDKLLNSFEKDEEIARRLSKDEQFFKDQIDTIKKESDESIEEEESTAAGTDPNDVIYSDDPIGGKHKSMHFWEEKMKAMRAKEENPVREDDIGTCFSRGFRPDNIALSGDACFSLNKQDRLKFPKGMLTSDESVIDFSERETPLDFLLALGFMVDEASNALKDEDIRSRLLAAITEARVWINKITTTQGTLLYLVAYKSRPKTMRYFLQLVEAIINKRINNAIKLDGFLRVLEKVEEGEIQMINILGADKFEDEENEEKVVRKQLRQLFITVYKIAEKEALMKGKQLSQQAIILLRILAAKYRAGLHPHLELIARYIGQDLLITETQLEAAMIFLSRLDTAEVKLKEFETYCDIKCDKKKGKSANKTESSALNKGNSSVPNIPPPTEEEANNVVPDVSKKKRSNSSKKSDKSKS